MKAIRLDYRSASAFKWKARGAPAPHGSDSEWKKTAPPINRHQQQFCHPHIIRTTNAKALNLSCC